MQNSFDVTSDIEKAIDKLSVLDQKNIAYAVAKAMTLTGQLAEKKLKLQMESKIDRPTRWTMNSTFVKFAKPTDLVMEVGIRPTDSKGRTAAGKYLQALIKGGLPRYKGADLSASKIGGYRGVLVPSKKSPVRLNKFGNVTLSKYSTVLSSARDAGRSQGGFYIAPVKRGSSVKAIFQRKSSFIRGTSTLENKTSRVFVLDPSPKPRAKVLDLPSILGKSIQRDFPMFMKQRFEQELARKLARY
tara:strand:+ start:18 stop:749 length:732 start_codon:yes stop_codon:yes gene_type:complete